MEYNCGKCDIKIREIVIQVLCYCMDSQMQCAAKKNKFLVPGWPLSKEEELYAPLWRLDMPADGHWCHKYGL